MRNQLIIVIIALIVLVGGGYFIFGFNSASPPFDVSEDPPVVDADDNANLEGVVDGQLTQQVIVKNSVNLAQDSFYFSEETIKGSNIKTTETIYTPSKSHKVTSYNDEDTKELYYTLDFTAVQKFKSSGYTLALQNPDNRVTNHINETFLMTLVKSVPMTRKNTVLVNGTEHLVFTGSQVTSTTPSPLATSLGVSEVKDVEKARLTLSENGVINRAEITVIASDSNRNKTIQKEISIESTKDYDVPQPEWVNETLKNNVGVEVVQVSNKEIVVTHKYGKTLISGDVLQITNSKSLTTQVTLNKTVSQGDTISIYRNDSGLQTKYNPSSQIDEGLNVLPVDDEYRIVILSQDEGYIGSSSFQFST